ncbi:MAG: tRNA lysidine(34) synthetase TilS [Brachyspira sp.]|nr:tRNA lysidine(34) synthetase TilS [Brachyspira sp.]
MYELETVVKGFLVKYGIEPSTSCVLGFSGGYDSLCLLHILHRLGQNIVALHLNHNWRGKESLADADFCENFCKNNGIEFYSETLSKDVPHTETAAREARYEFFDRAAEKFGSEVIFTAHNANDNAETVLYRIIKGTGIEGLSAISERRGKFYRPLLSVERCEIEAYCRKNGLVPNVDSSNFDTKYKRNFIRKEILPKLVEINPNAVDAINSLSEVAEEETEILKAYIAKVETKVGNSTKAFVELDRNLQNKLVYNLFRRNNLDYDREKILRVVDFIRENSTSKSGKTLSLTTDLFLFVSVEKFEIVRSVDKSTTEIRIEKEGIYEFDDYIFSIEKVCGDLPEKFPKDTDKIAFVNLENLNLTLRYRKDGDVLQPFGLSGSQKLKKYLNERKVPNFEKDEIPLLCCKNEVLWVCGYGISEKIKLEKSPYYVLKLTKKGEVGYDDRIT